MIIKISPSDGDFSHSVRSSDGDLVVGTVILDRKVY